MVSVQLVTGVRAGDTRRVLVCGESCAALGWCVGRLVRVGCESIRLGEEKGERDDEVEEYNTIWLEARGYHFQTPPMQRQSRQGLHTIFKTCNRQQNAQRTTICRLT